MVEFIAQGRVSEVERDDGGLSLSTELLFDGDDGLFIRVMSWDEDREHPAFEQLRGKYIKVVLTVEE